MSILKKISNLLVSRTERFVLLSHRGFLNFLPSKLFVRIAYKVYVKRKLNLKNPVLFNEKLQWLKIHNRDPLYNRLVDKYEVREYIKETIGENHLVPLIGVYQSIEDIPWEELPNRFVLKCTHGSSFNIICRDKSKLDITEAKKKLKNWLKRNWYWIGREWPYRDVKPRIICEKYITDSDSKDYLTDYKFYCFGGIVDSVLVCLDRTSGHTKFYFFDHNWQLKRYNVMGKAAPEGFTIEKPQKMDEMFEIAKKLSNKIPFVRIDLYCSNDNIYFGEFTLYPSAGFDPNRLLETEKFFGSKVDLTLVSSGGKNENNRLCD
jgi:hypothetical protein